MRSALLTLTLTTLLSACGEDSSPVGPDPAPVASLATADTAGPLDDAVARILPAFGDDQDVTGLQTALLRVQNNETAALAIAEQFLSRLERSNPDYAADADAIRLALNATR